MPEIDLTGIALRVLMAITDRRYPDPADVHELRRAADPDRRRKENPSLATGAVNRGGP